MTMAFGCSIGKTFRKSSIVGGNVTGRRLGSSLTWTILLLALPGSSARGYAQMSGPEEHGSSWMPAQGASPAFRKMEHCLFLHKTAKLFPFPSHCPLQRPGEQGKGRVHGSKYFREKFWGKMQTVQHGLLKTQFQTCILLTELLLSWKAYSRCSLNISPTFSLFPVIVLYECLM